MIRRVLAGLFFVGAIFAAGFVPAHAQQISQKVAVCNWSFATQCWQPGFTATGQASLSATTITSRVALGAGGTVVLQNTGSVTVYYKFGGSTVTAATTDFPITAGQVLVLNAGSNGYVAGITASGSATVLVTSGTGTPTIGQVGSGAVGNVNISQVAGAAVATGAGTAAGALRVELPTDGTGRVALSAATTGGASPVSKIVANNTTSVAICTGPCTLYAVGFTNNSATKAYVKLYNATQGSTTCGAGTPVDRILIPANADGAGIVQSMGGGAGVSYSTALTACTTTGIADNDTGAPAATTYLESYYIKQ